MSEVRPLRHLAAVRVSNVDKKSAEGQVPVRLCNYTDVYYGDRITPALDLMAATATREQVEAFRLNPGDVIITKDSEDPWDIGVPAFVAESAADLVCGYHLAVLRPDPSRSDGRYLYWALSSRPVRDFLSLSATGITRYGLRAESIASAPIQWWPLAQQQAIAAYLDAEAVRIDALIATKRRLIELLDERFRVWMSEWLNCTQAAGTDKTGPWPWVPLRHVVSVRGGLTLGKSYGNSRPYPYLRVANVQDRRLDLSEMAVVQVPPDVASRFTLRSGDVLMLEGNGNPENLGRGTIWRGEIDGCLHQNHVHAVRVHPNKMTPEYLDWVVRTPWARWVFTGASEQVSIATLSQRQILDLVVPVPPLEEQARIVEVLDGENRRATCLTEALDRQINLLVEHRQALITAAVTGELEVAA